MFLGGVGERSATVTPNRARVAACIAVGCSIGLLPYVLFLERPTSLVLYLPVAFVVGMLALRGFQSLATEEPEAGEYLLATWNAAMYGAGASLTALLFYALVYWPSRLLQWALASRTPGWSASAAAEWASLGVAAFVALGSSLAASEEIARKLYPDTAGTRSPYFDLILERRRLARMLALSLLATFVLVVLIDRVSVWFVPALLALIAVSAVSLDNLGKRPPDTGKQDVIEAIRKLLDAAGYDTDLGPRTGLADVDPLLVNIDLVARSSRGAIVIEVKSPAEGQGPVEWQEASRLRTACWALSDVLSGEGDARMDPVMVLVQRTATESLERFARDAGVRLARFESAEPLTRARGEHDPQRLRQMARDLLGVEASGPRVGLNPPAASAIS
jgi:hypothetical protein